MSASVSGSVWVAVERVNATERDSDSVSVQLGSTQVSVCSPCQGSGSAQHVVGSIDAGSSIVVAFSDGTTGGQYLSTGSGNEPGPGGTVTQTGANSWSVALEDRGAVPDPDFVVTVSVGAAQPLSDNWGPDNPSTDVEFPCAGDPVNCGSGNLVESATDLNVAGGGPAVAWSRTYNSLAALAAHSSTLGRGWTSSYDASLATDSSTGQVTVTQPGGATVEFTAPASGDAYDPTDAGTFAALTKNADGSWTFVVRGAATYTFDASGRELSVADPAGETTTLGYNSSGQLTTITGASGRQLALTYVASGNGMGDVSSVTDPLGRTVTYGYSSDGDLTSVTDSAGGVTTYTYGPTHLLTKIVDPDGNTASDQYDDLGRVVSQTDPIGRVTSFVYGVNTNGRATTSITEPNQSTTVEIFNALGELTRRTQAAGSANAESSTYTYNAAGEQTAATDPDKNTTSYTYARGGQVATITDPDGNTTSSTYNSFGEPLTTTSPTGVMTTDAYNALGDLTSSSTPLGTGAGAVPATTSYAYDDGSFPALPTKITSPSGHVVASTYTSTGDLKSVTDGLGDTTSLGYDADGEQTSSTDPDGKTTAATYTSTGQIKSATDRKGGTTSYGYDADGNRTSQIDANGDKTTYTYDADSELSSTTDAEGNTTHRTYDANGELASRTNAAGKAVTYAYNNLGELTSSTDPLNRVTSDTYDAAGRLLTSRSPAGVTTTNAYDPDGLLTSLAYNDGTPGVTYSYNTLRQRTGMTDASGTSTWKYDTLGRMTSSTDGAGKTASYGYDLDGNRTSLTYPDGQVVTYTYDAADQMESLTATPANGGAGSATTTSFGYDAEGDLISTTLPNGDTATTKPDPDGLPATMALTPSAGGSTLAAISYAHTAGGQVSSETDSGAITGTARSAYDTVGRLTSSSASVSGSSGTTVSNYAYDQIGNPTRLDTPAGTLAQTFDAGAELTSSQLSAGGENTTTNYTYDNDGNRTRGSPADPAGSRYSYDAQNHMVSATTSDQHIAGSTYHPVSPVGLVDTRTGLGTCTPSCAPLTAGETLVLPVDGQQGLPTTNINSVVLNITAFDPGSSGRIVAYPDGAALPVGRSMSLASGVAASTTTVVGVGNDGKIDINTTAAGNVVVQVVGWYQTPTAQAAQSGSVYESINGTRILDTRNGTGTCTPHPCSQLAAGATVAVQVAGQGGIPSTGVAAVAFTLTAFNPSATGHATAWPSDQIQPAWRDLSMTSAGDASDLVVVPLTATGKIDLNTTVASDFAMDLAGYYTTSSNGTGSVFVPYSTSAGSSQRILDTRNSTGSCTPSPCTTISTTKVTSVQVAGEGPVPTSATAVLFSATAWAPSSDGGTVIWPADQTRPPGRSISYTGSTTGGGNVQTGLSPAGAVDVESITSGSNLTLDVEGWFLPAGQQTTQYAYNGDGLRVTKTVPNGDGSGPTTTHFTYDATNSAPQLLTDGTADYIYGPSGAPLESMPSGANTSTSADYYFTDALGSTRVLTDATGAVTGSYSYTPWGQTIDHSGTSTALQYGRGYTDPETGLIYLGARYYDASNATFTTTDPLVDLTGQPYSYASDSPTTLTDPTGLCTDGFLCTAAMIGADVVADVVVDATEEIATGGAATAAEPEEDIAIDEWIDGEIEGASNDTADADSLAEDSQADQQPCSAANEGDGFIASRLRAMQSERGAAGLPGRAHNELNAAGRGVDAEHVWANGDLYTQVRGDETRLIRVLSRGNGQNDVVIRELNGDPVTSMVISDESLAARIEDGRWR
ncbi:MAG: DUF6531 domain-containing protein [Nocardioidaceae bacterium]|nr:DUF6531 domain-containing protein [Nocardioidaceae bacterium]MCL2613509.1 DUF6531 domain-containing protein [Nocardioidaceae bacterium]